ncbi:hypothetical protein SPI_06288 [Niveomyces insectorum RCEF 264]|uniref:Major facilitator superfamily transporter n=1 Tax=Niveomyces insectorum RCEF 264 TaxID=1081102 RepID=A0A167RZH0_9HYPO|nr:hypothetical protein SPI_06288 [Niveomyces insectorum RCEF 264]
MDRPASHGRGSASSSASFSSASSLSASRRNSFSLLEKPADGVSGMTSFSSFASLSGLSSSRTALLPMPVMTKASSALEVAKSSFRWLPSPPRIVLPSYVPVANLSFSPSSPLPSPSLTSPPRLRSLLGHCLYRRVFLWAAASLCTFVLVLLAGYFGHSSGFRFGAAAKQLPSKPKEPSAEAIWLNYTRLDGYFNGVRAVVPISQYHPEYPTLEDRELAQLQELAETTNATHIVARDDARIKKRTAAHASSSSTPALSASATHPTSSTATPSSTSTSTSTSTPKSSPMPTPAIYKAQPDYNSSEYRARFYSVRRCYLDAANSVPVPDLWAYPGVPQGQPEPLFGSHSLLGIRDDVCFERFGRYGPYGLGYGKDEGGIGEGLDTEHAGSEAVWSPSSTSGKINYSAVDWAAAQERCFEANRERFAIADTKDKLSSEYSQLGDELQMKKKNVEDKTGKRGASTTSEKPGAAASASPSSSSDLIKIERTAVVVRCYAGFKWTRHAVLNMRALIAELSLQSGGEYDVHLLLHARDENVPIWADDETAKQFIADNTPLEFRGLVTLWSEGQMRLMYPGMRGQPVFHNPSNGDIHGVYRSAHLPLQHFAQQHPEYGYFWNWEMDMRFLGSYYELFDRLGRWADNQPRRRLWERSAKYYIPALHGSWDDFTARVDAEAHDAGRPSILGPLFFAGRTETRDEENGVSPLPAHGCEGAVLSKHNRTEPAHNDTSSSSSSNKRFFADPNNNYTNIPDACGVGEAADLITLNPLFDADESGWMFANDVTGYDLSFKIPPRRTAIITASRLSRRLLFAMHEETWRLHHGMFSEMFPPSVALHRGFKAVYAPHPVYSDRQWPLLAAERAFNAGPDHSSGASAQSPFHPRNEHYYRGLTWYYNSDFAGRLWRRWLGYPQPVDDPTMPKPPRSANQTAEDEALASLAALGGGWGQEERPGATGRMCLRSMLVHPIKYEHIAEVLG